MSHGSTSRGVILALFMAAVRQGLAAPVLLFGTLGGHLQQHASIPNFLLHHRTGQYSLTEHSSSLALGAWPWLNR